MEAKITLDFDNEKYDDYVTREFVGDFESELSAVRFAIKLIDNYLNEHNDYFLYACKIVSCANEDNVIMWAEGI